MSWLRITSIALTALALASCRSMPKDAQQATTVVGSIDAGPVDFHPLTPKQHAAVGPSQVTLAGGATAERATFTGESTSAVQQVAFVSPHDPAACRSLQCQPGGCPPQPCPTVGPIRLMPAPPPLAGGCVICDGGDHLAAAKPVGDGIGQLTAGDTVARYRAEDDLEHQACITVSNCTCVFAPRFASVREVIRAHEDSTIAATSRVERDDTVEIDTGLDPVVSGRRRIGPDTARQKATGMGLETASVALAVADELLPDAAIGEEHPQAAANDQNTEPLSRVQDIRDLVGFDIPFAWTCLQQASVMVGEKPAAVVSSDRTTATLRIEEEGRAELTISKSAGSPSARAGEELDFTIAFYNSGDRPLADVVLVDALPQRLSYVADSADATVAATFSTGEGDDGSVVLTWRLSGTLQPGETGFVRFRTIVR